MEHAIDLVRLLEAYRVPTVIAGGAARDSLLGHIPKDFDLVVMSGDDLRHDVAFALNANSIPYSYYGDIDDNYIVSSGDAAAHLLWVIKTTINGIEFDIIQHVESSATPSEAVEGFDVSLNMAWVEIRDGYNWVVCSHPDFPEPGQAVKVLRTCGLPERRIPYLAEKFPGYQWPNMNKGS